MRGILLCVGLIAASATSGLGQTRKGGPREINRNWPDEAPRQVQLPQAQVPNWSGDDAVGLATGPERGTKPASNVVSVKTLRIPAAALKEMRKSDQALLAGDVRGSAEYLEKMLVYTPDLAVAHNSLGARYVNLREYEKAIGEFQKAVALDPKYRMAVDNIAVTLCVQHKYQEAEPVARWALQIEPEAASSKYLLGSILITQEKSSEEATKLLESVTEHYPRARLFLAKALESRGELDQAVEQLKLYMSSPRARENGVAQGWLARLETQIEAKKKVAEGEERTP
jgi:Tfp pilus assembly protein PilF